MHKFKNLISRFAKDTKGAVAIIAALALIPIMAASGAAIDYSRAFVVQNRLANALDATALAMGASNIKDQGKLQEFGQKFFDANYPADKLGVPGAIQVSMYDGKIRVTGTARLPTSLMGAIGIDKMNINASAEVMREQRLLEVAMVLDNTGSMGGQKLATLKTASSLLVDDLFALADDNKLVKIGLVPFASSVNVGKKYKKSGWIDRKAKSPLHGVNFVKKNGKPTNVFTLYNVLKNTEWNGCVEARSYPMDVEDTAPNKNKPATLWVPYFYPDEPDFGNYYHSYLPDKKGGTVQARQSHVAKYAGRTPGRNAYGSTAGPGFNCEITPITPLTDKKRKIKNAINAMVATGSTSIPIGMAWGWRVLSNEEPFTEGVPYNDKQNPATKVAVLMSDGDNVVGDLPNHNKSWYTGYGFVSEQINTSRLKTTSAWQARNVVDNRLEELCRNMKKKNIIVYTVAFELNNQRTKDLLNRCATDDSKFFDAQNPAALIESFKTVAKELGELRLTQ